VQVTMVEPGAIKTPLWESPQAAAMAEYSPWRDRFFKTMKNAELNAPGPEVVAEVFADLVRSRNPPLHNHVTREATMYPILRRLLPAGAFEKGVRSAFNVDNAKF